MELEEIYELLNNAEKKIQDVCTELEITIETEDNKVYLSYKQNNTTIQREVRFAPF